MFRYSSSQIVLCYLCFQAVLNVVEAQNRPNVLFIVIDDLRTALGCYGEPLLKTPNIDNLASKSILFEQAFVQQPVCGPSRVSFLTSRRPDTTRLYDFYSYWRVHAGNYTTLPQHFKENGYITQSVGKIFHPGIAANKTEDSRYSWTNTPYQPSSQQYRDAKVCPDKNGTLGKYIVCPVDVPLMPEKTLPDLQIADFAVEFLKNVSATQMDKPFFLAVGFNKPHIPLKYPKKYKSLYPTPEVSLAKYNTYPLRMPLVAWNSWVDFRNREDIEKLKVRFPFGPVPDYYQILIRQSYYAATSYMDAQVGKVLQALERNGFSENTIISFISDHGFSLGEHQEWSKYSLFEVAARVPFILYVPGVTYTKTNRREKIFPYLDVFVNNSVPKSAETSTSQANTTLQQVSTQSWNNVTQKWVFEPRYKTSAPVELVDLFPTLAEAAGLPTLPLCPNNPYKVLLCTEGTSLMPLIKNVTARTFKQAKPDSANGKIIGHAESSKHKEWQNLLNLAENCSKDFMPITTVDFQCKRAAFSQYPRGTVEPQWKSELPRLINITVMGYSMWTPDFHYTEWVGFIPTNYTVLWEEVYGRELYLRLSDPYEINNVAILERCFPLVIALSRKLHDGWRGALLY